MTEPVITLQDCRDLGYCSKGLRAFCKRKGLDWDKLRVEGMPLSEVEKLGEGMADAAAKLVRERMK